MEILSIVMVIGAVASIVVPSVGNFFSSQQVSAQAALLTNDIRLARATAIENQGYCRIVFRSDLTGWVVQELTDSTGKTIQEETAITFPVPEPPTDYQESPTNWRSILDGLARELDDETTLSMSKPPPASLFFRYDGLIVNSPNASALPIQTRVASFTFGESAVQVDITPAGAVESIEYFRDDY